MAAPRYNFPADGEWDVVADCESAGIVDEQIRRDGETERLTVRSHPWLKPGTVIAFNQEMHSPGKWDDAAAEALLRVSRHPG